jgi:hypothetical protein
MLNFFFWLWGATAAVQWILLAICQFGCKTTNYSILIQAVMWTCAFVAVAIIRARDAA